jgi:hypothetical protein
MASTGIRIARNMFVAIHTSLMASTGIRFARNMFLAIHTSLMTYTHLLKASTGIIITRDMLHTPL